MRSMTQKLKTIGLYFLQIILTAVASAIIAFLQNYIQAHGGDGSGTISAIHTATIGGVISTGQVGYKSYKSNFQSNV